MNANRSLETSAENTSEKKKGLVVVIGAGLTGLTTAYHLCRRGFDVQVLEQQPRIGGQIQSHSEEGFLFESGPNTGVVSYPEVAELFASLSPRCELETAQEAAARRLIWKGNRFHALPSGLLSALFTPLFTLSDKLRILGEPWRAKGNHPDESVGALARRRLGRSFVDYAVDPFL
ncbi:MAG: protoporphyrinogen oxidase, partial [Prevotellaceae bacterium]|nr:protoporphyrinogen oxidase [Prevotellaceae bacterium]